MYQNRFNTYIKKAILVLTAMAFGLGLTLHPGDSHALVDSSEPYLVKDINPGDNNSNPGGLTKVNGTLFFSADDGVYGEELWRSDGTGAGTVMVKDINPGDNHRHLDEMTDVNGTLFISAEDGEHGLELWKSDGTPEGTQLVKDIMVKDLNPSAWSDPSYLTDVNGTLFFYADDGVHGRELWKSDGTPDGTQLVKDINPGIADSCNHLYEDFCWTELTEVNGMLFFAAEDGVHGTALWKSDGTADGTVMVKDIDLIFNFEFDMELTDVNGTLFLPASDGVHGWELWKSDGTPEGTVMVKDINPSGSSSPRSLTDVNGTLFFRANDGIHDEELWKSDGTPEGTVMVKDIYPGGDSSPHELTGVNGTLFFRADDGVHGRELWKSVGTPECTVMVKDIYPGESLGPNSSYPRTLTNVNGTLFFGAEDGVHGTELWKSDGTAAGTVMVMDIYPGFDYYAPSELTDVNGTLFFGARDDVHGYELWALDVPEEPSIPPSICGTTKTIYLPVVTK